MDISESEVCLGLDLAVQVLVIPSSFPPPGSIALHLRWPSIEDLTESGTDEL